MAQKDMNEQERLIWILSHTACALNDAIRKALEITDPELRMEVLNQARSTGRELLRSS